MKAVYKKIREMMICKRSKRQSCSHIWCDHVGFSGACICNASLLDDFNST